MHFVSVVVVTVVARTIVEGLRDQLALLSLSLLGRDRRRSARSAGVVVTVVART